MPEFNQKTAYIAAGATIIAALIASLVPLIFTIDTDKPSASIDGNNNNVVQGARDVTIDQRVNDLDVMRDFEAQSLQSSLVSGCQTLNGYFVNEKFFDVDSVDTLIGPIWVQKEKFISYFGAENQRIAMQYVDQLNPPYLEYIVGLEYFRGNREIMLSRHQSEKDSYLSEEEQEAIIGEGFSEADLIFKEKMDTSRPQLVAITNDLCDHLSSLKR